jgi:hypothetical protein
MRKILIGGLIAVSVALVVYSRAQAAPLDEGSYLQLSRPIVACNERKQMDDIVQAIKDGKLQEKLTELQTVVDKDGEPVCIYSPMGPLVFGASEHIGQIKDHDRTVDTWISHVGNQKAEFYVLWGEVVKESSI